jgi:hypothetical protein
MGKTSNRSDFGTEGNEGPNEFGVGGWPESLPPVEDWRYFGLPLLSGISAISGQKKDSDFRG